MKIEVVVDQSAQDRLKAVGLNGEGDELNDKCAALVKRLRETALKNGGHITAPVVMRWIVEDFSQEELLLMAMQFIENKATGGVSSPLLQMLHAMAGE